MVRVLFLLALAGGAAALVPSGTRRAVLRQAATAVAVPAALLQTPFPALAEDIQTTPSGLKYIEVKPGTGLQPKAGQTVSVHYTGGLTTLRAQRSLIHRMTVASRCSLPSAPAA